MTSHQREIWREIRKKGKKHFIITRFLTGLLLGLLVSVVREIFTHGLVMDQLLSIRFANELLQGLLIFAAVFYLSGEWIWWRNEKKFHQE